VRSIASQAEVQTSRPPFCAQKQFKPFFCVLMQGQPKLKASEEG